MGRSGNKSWQEKREGGLIAANRWGISVLNDENQWSKVAAVRKEGGWGEGYRLVLWVGKFRQEKMGSNCIGLRVYF